MSGKLANDLARNSLTELRDLTGFVFHPRDVAIIAEAIEEGIRRCRLECEDKAIMFEKAGIYLALSAVVQCIYRISALLEEK